MHTVKTPASWLLLVLLCLLAAAGCEKKKEAPAAKAVRVGIVAARSGDAALSVGGVGHVQAMNSVAVQSQVTGVLNALLFTEGATVKKGQLLARIDQAPFLAALHQAKSALERDAAQAEQAKRDHARYKDLVQREVVSQDEYEQRRTQYLSAEEQARADKAAVEAAQINLGYCDIYAPLDGVVGYQQVDPGNTVNAYKDTILTINQVQPIVVRFSVNEGDLPLVRKHFSAGQLPATARPAKSEGDAAEQGVLTAMDNAVDPKTGMITLQAQFDNTGLTLWPGEFVQVDVILSTEQSQVLIPTDALIRRQDGDFVFVAAADDKAELRKVRPGRTVGSEIVIAEGLAAGERIVADGLVQVYPGALLEAKDAPAPAAAQGAEKGSAQ